MTFTPKKVFGYGALAVMTAPLWIPAAFVGYVGLKATRFAFRHATPVAFALGIGGVLGYMGCHHREKVASVLERVSADAAPSQVAAPLEERVSGPTLAPTRMVDEPGYAYRYVRDGETLGRIAAEVTGNGSLYREIARENQLWNPDDVAVGTLLRIPDRLCRRDAPNLYDRVPSLNSMTLPGSAKISEMFGEKTAEVLAINRALGLSYSDAYPYSSGERVVWFSSGPR